MSGVPRPTRLIVLGHPIEHSLSPLFQQAALDACGIALRYERLDVPPVELGEVLVALRRERAAGNITIPHKQAAIEFFDALSPLARRVGAVNTFWVDAAGRLVGDNTDVGGFDAAVRGLLVREPSGIRVLLLGAGGAALAVREAVASWGDARLSVWTRRQEQAVSFVAPLGAHGSAVEATREALNAALEAADLIVNATPLGLRADDELPFDPERLQPRQVVLDLTYHREGPTALVTACRARGIRADDGLRMLVEQGALAFERWFAQPAPRNVMMAAIRR